MEYAIVKIIIIFGWSRHFHDEMAISYIQTPALSLGLQNSILIRLQA